MTKPKRYVGITGFKNQAEVGRAVGITCQPGMPDYVMLGFTCSNKRLADPESSGRTSPSLASLPGLVNLARGDNLLPMLHYYTVNLDNLAKEVVELFSYGGLYWSGCQAVQLNAEWPAIDQLDEIKQKLPDLKIVLQLPKSALQADDDAIVISSTNYGPLVDYILVDPSGGEGEDLDLERATKLLPTLDDALPNTAIGLAGGFSADNVEQRVTQVIKAIDRNDFCIDAQGRLRSKLLDDSYLDMVKAEKYLRNAAKAYTMATSR